MKTGPAVSDCPKTEIKKAYFTLILLCMTHDPELTSTQTLSLQKSKAYTEDNFFIRQKIHEQHFNTCANLILYTPNNKIVLKYNILSRKMKQLHVWLTRNEPQTQLERHEEKCCFVE